MVIVVMVDGGVGQRGGGHGHCVGVMFIVIDGGGG